MFKIEKPHRFTIIVPTQALEPLRDLAQKRCLSVGSLIRTMIFAEIEKQRQHND